MQMDIIFEIDHEQITKKDLVEIYEKYSGKLFAYAFRLVGDSQFAEDCVSETFSRFLKTVQRGVGSIDNLNAYLYRIAHNWIMDYYRNRLPEQENKEISLLQNDTNNPEALVSKESERQKVRKALLNLPEKQRQVIMFRFYEEWSHAETASALGTSAGATRALQYRALESLRNMLIPAQGKGKVG